MKVEFDVWLISSMIELTRVQVSDRLCTSLWRYSTLFAIAPHPQSLRNHGPKALLCTRMAFPHTMREPEINYMDLGRAVQNECKDQAKVDFRRPRLPIVLQCPGSLKGERMYSSLMNLPVSR